MNKSKEKIKENPIVANRAIYMANPCHIIDKVVPLYWHNSYTNEKKLRQSSTVGAFRWTTKIRTWTNRTKTCCATITP